MTTRFGYVPEHVRSQSDDDLRLFSMAMEQCDGWDSVETIERVYLRTGLAGTGAFMCCFPNCTFASRQALVLWQHIHFSPVHVKEIRATTAGRILMDTLKRAALCGPKDGGFLPAKETP